MHTTTAPVLLVHTAHVCPTGFAIALLLQWVVSSLGGLELGVSTGWIRVASLGISEGPQRQRWSCVLKLYSLAATPLAHVACSHRTCVVNGVRYSFIALCQQFKLLGAPTENHMRALHVLHSSSVHTSVEFH